MKQFNEKRKDVRKTKIYFFEFTSTNNVSLCSLIEGREGGKEGGINDGILPCLLCGAGRKV